MVPSAAGLTTYIQNGNVIFSTATADERHLERSIEHALSKQFKYKSRVVVVSHETIKSVVEEALEGFGVIPLPTAMM